MLAFDARSGRRAVFLPPSTQFKAEKGEKQTSRSPTSPAPSSVLANDFLPFSVVYEKFSAQHRFAARRARRVGSSKFYNLLTSDRFPLGSGPPSCTFEPDAGDKEIIT